MAFDAKSAIGQLQKFHTQMSAYADGQSKSFSGGGPTVSFSSILSGIDFSALITLSDSLSQSGGSVMRGIVTDTMQTIQAIQREQGMRNMTKQGYYADASKEMSQDATNHNNRKVVGTAVLQGKSTDQATK